MAFKVGDMDLIILHCLAIRTCLMFAEIWININVLLKDVQWTTWSISMGNFPNKSDYMKTLCQSGSFWNSVLANQQSYIIFYHDQLFNVEFHTCTSIKLSFFLSISSSMSGDAFGASVSGHSAELWRKTFLSNS